MIESPLTRRRRARGQRSGFSLLELLFAITLLGVFLLISGRIFASTMKVIRRDAANDAAVKSVESACASLRKDIWNASSMQIENGKLMVRRPHDSITWSVNASDETFVRSAAGDVPATNAWKLEGATIQMTVVGSAVDITVTPKSGGPSSTQRMVSQLELGRSKS